MKESQPSLQEQWGAYSQLRQHHNYLGVAMDEVRSSLILPGDARYETAVALLASGRGATGVLAIGDPGTGKTLFGDVVLGPDKRVEISATDTEDVLYGYTNPINGQEVIPGKLQPLATGDPSVHASEISQAANTGPFHRLHDSKAVGINGEVVDLSGSVFYYTTNFPNGGGAGQRVKVLDSAFRSRQSMELLTGDNEDAISARIQGGKNASNQKDLLLSPVLPPASVRRVIHKLVQAEYPDQSNDSVGEYIVALIRDLNKGGFLSIKLSTTEARTGAALHDLARARLFMLGAKAKDLEARDIAEVAALALPTITGLNHEGQSRILQETGQRATSLEQAIALRRVIARTAFTTLVTSLGLFSVEPGGDKQSLERNINAYSYANTSVLDFDIDKALFGGSAKANNEAHKAAKHETRKRFGRRR